MTLTAGMAALLFAGQASAACKVGYFAAMPISLESGRPMTSALINGTPVDLAVNSGAFYSFLSKDTAQALKLAPKAISVNFGFVVGKRDTPAGMALVNDLKFGRQSLPNSRFLVFGGDNAPKDNMIGQNILSQSDTEYDLQGGVIRLANPHGCTGKDMAYWTAEPNTVRVVTLEVPDSLNRQTIGKVTVNGIPMRAMFDMSGGGSRLSAKAVRTLTGSAEAADSLEPLKLASLDIGGEMQTDLTLDVVSSGGARDVDLFIGLDFFKTHRIYVANGRRMLFFTPYAQPALAASPGTP